MSMFGLEYLVAECWEGPAVTMVVNTISPENKGFAVSAYLLIATISGTAATFILEALYNYYDAENNKHLYGQILCGFVVFSYAGSVPFFYLAG